MTKQLFVRRDQGDVVVLRILERELSDLVLQDLLEVALTDFVKTQRPNKLLLDLSDVEYCATGVINTFLVVRKRVNEQGGRLILCSLSEPLRQAFRSLNLEKTVFSILPTTAEGVEAFDARSQANG